MNRRFVLVSGLPGSGKTTLARQLAPALGLPLIDKDDILERLFEAKGIGDATWRRALSRESDVLLQNEAAASMGAVLTSMWRQPGMTPDSGTPTHWLLALSNLVVDVHCVCSPEIAATRFMQRKRHAGHLDGAVTLAAVLNGLRAQAHLGALDIGPRVDVDTSDDLSIDTVVREIHGAFARCVTPAGANDDRYRCPSEDEARMETKYACLKCEHRFDIAVTESEMASHLNTARSDSCPQCGQRVGAGPVRCRSCGAAFELDFPHWHVSCDLATGQCPACGAAYQSLCIC